MGQLELAFSGGKPSAPFEGAKAIPRPLGVVVYGRIEKLQGKGKSTIKIFYEALFDTYNRNSYSFYTARDFIMVKRR